VGKGGEFCSLGNPIKQFDNEYNYESETELHKIDGGLLNFEASSSFDLTLSFYKPVWVDKVFIDAVTDPTAVNSNSEPWAFSKSSDDPQWWQADAYQIPSDTLTISGVGDPKFILLFAADIIDNN
jgi:hypothetical protein